MAPLYDLISPKFENFGSIIFLVAPPSPTPPHANACTGHNFVTNTPIKFIFAIAIEVPDYKNPMIFGSNRKACGVSNCVINSPINFIFGIAIDNTKWKNPIVFGANRTFKMAAGGHFEKTIKKQVVY